MTAHLYGNARPELIACLFLKPFATTFRVVVWALWFDARSARIKMMGESSIRAVRGIHRRQNHVQVVEERNICI